MVAQEQQKPFVIGLDLGGTNSVFGIVDQRGNILTTNSIKTQAYKTAEDFVSAGVEALKPIIAKVGGIEQIKAMGIGAPNGNYYRGTIEFAPNVPWGHDGVIPLADMFSEKLGIPVGLTNDANAAAYGEYIAGGAKGYKDAVVITLGTGIGTALIYNGVLIPNTVLGHIILSAKHLDAEKYASSAIRENEELGYKKWAKRLTKYYGLMEKYFNPDLFTVGGGVSRQSEKFLPYVDIKTPIVPAKLRNQAGIVGAAYYASTKQQ